MSNVHYNFPSDYPVKVQKNVEAEMSKWRAEKWKVNSMLKFILKKKMNCISKIGELIRVKPIVLQDLRDQMVN